MATELVKSIDQKIEELQPQIAEWKKKHGELYTVKHNGHLAIFRKPRVMDLERAMAASTQKKAKSLDFNRVIVRECALHTDPAFDLATGDQDSILALLTSVGEIAAIPEAEVGKL